MAAPRKTRSLRLADGSTFRVGPRTQSVDVSDMGTDPPAHTLHINRSTAVFELPPDAAGVPQFPVRVSPDTVVELVARINAVRAEETATCFGADAPHSPYTVPPTIQRLAKHTAQWAGGQTPLFRVGRQTGYPGKHPDTGTPQALYVDRTTGKCHMWTGDTAAPDPTRSEGDYHTVSRRDAVAWLHANGYAFVPAVLVAPRTTGKGAADDAPTARGATDGG